MKRHYDIVIIGGGIGALMCAYRLSEKKPDLAIAILEKGSDIKNRKCPIVEKKVKKCVRCASCAIMEGLAGAGAFSDGKYIISTEYGGWLTDFLDPGVVMSYIEQADQIMVGFGATEDRFLPNDALKQMCLKYDLHMLQAKLKHLGTDANFDTMSHMIDALRDRVAIFTGCDVTDIDPQAHEITYQLRGVRQCGQVSADKIVFAVGRAGSRFFIDWCRKNGITVENNQVDIGVRVELPAMIWTDFSAKIYEPKIWYRSKAYGDVTRMFCFNERGNVVVENTDGVLTVNGHAYKDQAKKTETSNFALLTTIRFTQPFNDPIEYARYVAALANKISGGSVLVQRLGDLEAGKRTDEKRLAASTTRPTLDAVPGDLSLCMPKRQLDNIIETLHALDRLSPGTANYDTLLYGVECKYYSGRPLCDDFEIVGYQDLYVVGDGGGFTRSLSHAAAHGLYIADKLAR